MKTYALTGLALGMGLAVAAFGTSQAAKVLGNPNPGSQVGRQGTKSNQMTNSLNGKPNRHRSKKVTNNTTNPMPAAWVSAGATIFGAQCASCHGPDGNGTLSAPRLSAPSGVWYTFHTPSRLENFIQTHMPGNHPGTLTRTQAKYVSAYVWSISKSK